LEALAPFRSSFVRESDRSEPLPYLSSPANAAAGAVDMQLEALIQTSQMRSSNIEPERLSFSNFKDSYWTIAQMLTHHTMNGCNLRPGDFFGSGTMSGSVDGSQGALIEITQGGSVPVQLCNGEQRTFLEDGDSIILRAKCVREGAVTIGFGEAIGTVEAARV
ncbi:MAG: fumarylacetoacetate hydrolase family protein, partial [Pseudomonadales bacterium]|nr:fumarylacetoacetate hydrolase family protein [Pseudomonadales bacterium]